MKKLLLTIMAVAATSALSAQVFHSEDFNALTIGDVGTVFDYTAQGQGGFLTFASNGAAGSTTTNAGNSNFQIVAGGEMMTNGLQVVGPDGDDGFRQVAQPPFDWTTRTAGNEFIEVEFSFNTGPATNSVNFFRWILRSDDGTTSRNAVAIQYESGTGELVGLAALNNNGTEGLFGFDLGTDAAGAAAPLVLPANTWVRVGISYDTVTGEVRWKSDFSNVDASFTNAAFLITGQTPDDFISISFDGSTAGPPVVANAAAHTIVMDNMEVRASAADTLLSAEDAALDAADITIFPNPSTDRLNISSDVELTSFSILDFSGRVIKTADLDGSSSIDTTSLSTGTYLLQLSNDNGTTTQQFVKK